MGSTYKTAYLKLNQYIGSDKRKMADYNADMLAIDNHFVALRDGTDGVKVKNAETATNADKLRKPDASYAAGGTAAFLNVPATAGAAATASEVVRGDDPRLTDQRVPVNESVSDSKIGNRTISDTAAPTGDEGALTTLLGWLAAMIKAITGKPNWRTAPEMSIATLAGKFHATTGHGHSGGSGDAPKISASGLADGAASDSVIGNRTIDDTNSPTGNSGTLGTLLSWLGNRIKAITGKSAWSANPDMTIATLAGKFDASSGHTHAGTAGNGPKLTAAGLADGAASDAVIGSRTINDTLSPTSDAGPLASLLSWLGNRIKAITGEESWRTANDDTLISLRESIENHGHTIDKITGLQTALDGKASVAHTHASLAALAITGALVPNTLGVANVYITTGTTFPPGSPDGSVLLQYSLS